MKFNIRYIASAVVMTFALSAVAQNMQSAYFTDGYLYRFQSNPAFDNERNFVAIPAIGNMNLGFKGTLSLEDIFYNINGGNNHVSQSGCRHQ